MDIILNPHYPMLLLSVLTFVCGWLVIPYRLNLYNIEWLPQWIRHAHRGIQGTDAKADRGEEPPI